MRGTDDRQDGSEGGSARWHDRTLERSLQHARARAISTGDRFIRAATALLRERGRPDFTVQEVVERSGMSLRSFYHHFATKDDLLLAVVEESVRTHHRRIAAAVAAVADPLDQLRAFVLAYSGAPEDDDPASRGMAIFHLHLAESRGADYVATFEGHTGLLLEIIQRGQDAGQIRVDVMPEKVARFITYVLASAINMRVLGVHLFGEDLHGPDLWVMIEPSVRPEPAPTATSRRRR